MKISGVDLIDDGDMVVKSFLDNGFFEPESLELWEKSLKPYQVAIDVGAYTGLYAIKAAAAGCLAVAYEPNPVVFSRLVENMALNEVEMATFNKAVADQEGSLSFFIKPGPRLTSASSLIESSGFQKISVDTVTLISDQPVCCIKIDVEGAEISVLRGAKDLLVKYHPVVILECLTDDARTEIVNFMSDLGYKCSVLDHRNLGFT